MSLELKIINLIMFTGVFGHCWHLNCPTRCDSGANHYCECTHLCCANNSHYHQWASYIVGALSDRYSRSPSSSVIRT